MLTWSAVAALALGVYGQRALGAVLLDTERVPAQWQTVLSRLPLAIIAAVIALQTLTTSSEFVLDARAAGVAAAGICAWQRMPIFGIVLVAASVTALVRALA